MNKRVILLVVLVLLSGCGGPARATPTPIPANVVRPKQPTPIYPDKADVFSLATPVATPQFPPTPAASTDSTADLSANAGREAIKLFIQNQTPSAVGIAAGGASIYSAPGGRAVAGIPVAGVVTVTGKSADGQWYSVYDNDFAFGWAPAGQLRVFGGEDLVVVEQALDPAPVATLLAQAGQPVTVLDSLMATLDASPAATAPATTAATPLPRREVNTTTPEAPVTSATVPTPAATLGALATPTAQPANLTNNISQTTVASGESTSVAGVPAALTGTVVSDERLNVRTAPDTGASIVVKLEPGVQVTVIDRSSTGAWLRVQLENGATGWVSAEFVKLNE